MLGFNLLSFTLILVVLVYSLIFLPDQVASLRGDVAAAFTYVTNWYLIFAQQSYFEDIGRPSLLKHLWSLAVEEQFYVFFPLLFAIVLTRLKARGAMWLLMLGAALSALWMGVLYVPDADPSRIYYGTDTRGGLLLGAALAFAWKPLASQQTLKESKSWRWKRWLLDLVGIAALGGLVAACLFLNEYDPFLYQGGLLLVSAATALVIAAVVHPQSPLLAPVLGTGILRWIGLRLVQFVSMALSRLYAYTSTIGHNLGRRAAVALAFGRNLCVGRIFLRYHRDTNPKWSIGQSVG